MLIDGNDRIVVDSQHFQFPHETEIVVLQLRDAVASEAEWTQVAQQSQRLERNSTEIVVAQVERLETVLESPERQKVELVDAVVSEQEAFDFHAEKVADLNL